ncbi:MAG: Ig-like domain-containing protein [Vicinamibacteraceae bacterium]
MRSRSLLTSVAVALALVAGAMVAGIARPEAAQIGRAGPGTTRKAATLAALTRFPFYFHTQPVRVRGLASEKDGQFQLEHEAARVWLVPGGTGKLPDPGKEAEITGLYLDVGRLDRTDARVTADLGGLSQRVLKREWPAPGELLVVIVDTAVAAEPMNAPSVRHVALDPGRYIDAEVTVVGRFRGKNLYGDMPEAAGKGRFDFVLQSADASIWVTGRRPKGDGFDLNVENRIDTGRWLEVAGVVKEERGMAVLEATAIRVSRPPAESAPEAVVKVPVTLPPPEVVFSAPTQSETDVEPGAKVRIQFSRDLRDDSLKGGIAIAYAGVSAPPPAFTVRYDAGRRVAEITFATPLSPFANVQVVLKETILGTDGQPLRPYTLAFTVGS